MVNSKLQTSQFILRTILVLNLGFVISGCLTDSFTANNGSTFESPSTNLPPSDPMPPPMDPPPGSNLVPVFMATGHVASTMYSCNGESWRGYRTSNNNLRCWDAATGNFDCDHASTSALGIAYGPEGFMVTYGWGQPGNVEHSTNGTTWNVVRTGGTWAGIAYGNGTYILNERSPMISSNVGQTWIRGGNIDFIPWNARKIAFINLNNGFFVSTANASNVGDLMISRDNGATFTRPNNLPAECGDGRFAHSNSTILLYSQGLCRSTDFGVSWQVLPTKPNSGNLIFDGTEFKIYDRGQVHRSTNNGSTWSATPLQVNSVNNSNLEFAHVSYSAQMSKYIGIVQSWGRYYEQTQYYHSTNGINWIQIDKSAGLAPNSIHPVRQVTTGFLPASQCE